MRAGPRLGARGVVALAGVMAAGLPGRASPQELLPLEQGWSIQSSARLSAQGAELSRPGFDTSRWQRAKVPNTVVGALVENGTYPDPYFGMNLRSIPGTDYPIGKRFTLMPTPADSPFKPSWWYRTEFQPPRAPAGRSYWLRFEGINYRANIWLNGTRLAHDREVVGAFRRYELDVTSLLRPGEANALAVEVRGPEPEDLAVMWVDWNPTPADKNMGLTGPVSLASSGPAALRNPHVVSRLDLPSLSSARLSVTAEVWNATDRNLTGTLRGTIESIRFSQPVALAPRERKTLRFEPERFPELVVRNPRVWWPYRMGEPNLYDLSLELDVDGAASDRQAVRFGIQQMSSELTKDGHRAYRVNGKPILIRGGGWASDMLLRPASRERLEAELRYVKEMGLNTVRLEGKLESDLFYELADREGILLMPGWCCCDQWELWDKWDDEDHRVGPASLRDQILRIRNHPSVFVWLNGSDFPPPERVEKAYLDVLKELEWSKPVLSNATDTPGPLSGPSGVKMRGPYDYVPPSYWLTDKKRGGAFGFATEMGPGAAVPPIESLKRMVPAQRLWPINEFWTFHAGGDEFKDLRLFTEALEGRYGKATSAEDYARKSQALTYEGQRAMFEAFGRNKYVATGVIQWMLNNAWPSLIWHLYDYYLRPAGGYFGTLKACEPLHVQYSYDDRSVVVVSELTQPQSGLKVAARVYDLGLQETFAREARVDVAADGVTRAFTIPPLSGLSKTYFVRLSLDDAAGKRVSSNFYWLSTQEDVVDFADESKWWYTPTRVHADLTALAGLPPTSLGVQARFEGSGPERAARVSVANKGSALAFQVRLKLVDDGGDEILPVYWQDNYFELFPGEAREVSVAFPAPQRSGPLRVEAGAWNAPLTTASGPP